MRVGEISSAAIDRLFERYHLTFNLVPLDAAIPFSHWGAPEAGIRGSEIFARLDTPVHSMLHEMSHLVCMDSERRLKCQTDAGGDPIEECAVCYLQVLLADYIPKFGRQRVLTDMDDWGYSFRQGSAQAWFVGDGRDAAVWLAAHHLIDVSGAPNWNLRR